MSAIFILVTASLTVALGFLAAFIWSVKSGQYDDDYTPSVRMLYEDKPSSGSKEKHSPKAKSSKYGTGKI